MAVWVVYVSVYRYIVYNQYIYIYCISISGQMEGASDSVLNNRSNKGVKFQKKTEGN